MPYKEAKPLTAEKIKKLFHKAPPYSQFKITYGDKAKERWDSPNEVWVFRTISHLSREAARKWCAEHSIFKVEWTVVRPLFHNPLSSHQPHWTLD